MIDLKALLQEEKALEKANGKNHYFRFPVAMLKDINESILSMKKQETKENLRQTAIVMEVENPNSIILTFVAGRINLLLNPHEAQIRLNNLMLSFHEMRNTDAAEFIAETILQTIETSTPLRVLAELSDIKGKEEEKWHYYERYVKCNSSDTEIIMMVADNYEKKGDKKSARNYYQRALQRLPYNRESEEREEFFKKVLANGTSDFSFTYSYLTKVGVDVTNLYKLLLADLEARKAAFTEETPALERNRNTNNIITVCKTILEKKDDAATKESLVKVLKERYGTSSRYIECSRTYDIMKSDKPAKTCSDFIRNISYSKGTYVVQNSTAKVGLIMDIDAHNIVTIKYSNRPDGEQKIKLQTVIDTFSTLPKTDIRAIKKGKRPEAIKEQILKDGGAEWLLKTMLLSSSGSTASIKEMKDQIVPSILNDKEWESIVKTMKAIAVKDPYIDINKTSYHLRDFPSSLEERRKEAFDSVKEFDKKVEVLMDSSIMEGLDLCSDPFLEMCAYFLSYSKDDRNSIGTRMEAVLLLEILTERKCPVASDVTFESLCSRLSIYEKKSVYEELSNQEARKKFIELLIDTDKKAYEVLEIIFPRNPTKELMKKMMQVNPKKFSEYVAKVLQNYSDNMIAFCFFVQNGVTKEQLKDARMNQKQLVERELNALSEICTRTADAKQANDIRKDLIEKNSLEAYIKAAEEDELRSVATHLKFNAGLKTSEKDAFRKLILSRFPSFDFGDKVVVETKPVEVSVIKGFLCTKKSFEAKQAEMKDIKEVQLPQTLKEINDARELGDLRENSEYQYAKDHKRHLDRMYEEIATELSSVKIMTPNEVVDGLVGFGTKVTINDELKGQTIVYTFMGRWESDPNNNIIDMNAPIGKALLNHRVGDLVEFEISSNKFSYRIKNIEKVSF